jgi:sec-independent protein translocase protein TatA
MGSVGVPELLVVLVLVLIVFGAGKLPEVMSSLGKGVAEFRKASAIEPEPRSQPKSESGPPEEK